MSAGIVKSGWLIVNSTPLWCELYGDLRLSCKLDQSVLEVRFLDGHISYFQELKVYDLRYKYVDIAKDEAENKELVKFKIKDETRNTLATIEPDNWDVLVEWVSSIEGLMFSLYNKDNRVC